MIDKQTKKIHFIIFVIPSWKWMTGPILFCQFWCWNSKIMDCTWGPSLAVFSFNMYMQLYYNIKTCALNYDTWKQKYELFYANPCLIKKIEDKYLVHISSSRYLYRYPHLIQHCCRELPEHPWRVIEDLQMKAKNWYSVAWVPVYYPDKSKLPTQGPSQGNESDPARAMRLYHDCWRFLQELFLANTENT